MRRAGFIVVTVMALLAIGAGSVLAKPTTSFAARANHGEQGGQLQVQAKVKHPMRGSTFSATAVVHFASGDYSFEMTRHGKSFVAAGKAPVPADQPVGPVSVDVTMTYNGVPQMTTVTGVVQPADEDDGDDEDTDEDED